MENDKSNAFTGSQIEVGESTEKELIDSLRSAVSSLELRDFRIRNLSVKNLSPSKNNSLRSFCESEGFGNNIKFNKGLAGNTTMVSFPNGVDLQVFKRFLDFLKTETVSVMVRYNEKDLDALNKLHEVMLEMAKWPNVSISHSTRKFRNKK